MKHTLELEADRELDRRELMLQLYEQEEAHTVRPPERLPDHPPICEPGHFTRPGLRA